MRFLILRMVTRNGDILGMVTNDVDGRLDGDVRGVVAHAVRRRARIQCRKVGNIRYILRVRNHTLFGGEWRYGPLGRFASWFASWFRRRFRCWFFRRCNRRFFRRRNRRFRCWFTRRSGRRRKRRYFRRRKCCLLALFGSTTARRIGSRLKCRFGRSLRTSIGRSFDRIIAPGTHPSFGESGRFGDDGFFPESPHVSFTGTVAFGSRRDPKTAAAAADSGMMRRFIARRGER